MKIFRWRISLNLHDLYFNYTIYSLKNFSGYGRSCRNYSPSLNHSGLFVKNFVKFKGKKVLFTSLSRSVLGKNRPSDLSTLFPIRTSRLVNDINFRTKSRVGFVLMRLLCLQYTNKIIRFRWNWLHLLVHCDLDIK